MPFLAQVYSGRLDSEQTTMRECSEQQIEVCVLPGGIQIAGIDHSDLEYDPVLYQRDRGELYRDERFIVTPFVYQGPGMDSEMGLARLDISQQSQLPLAHVPNPGPSYPVVPVSATVTTSAARLTFPLFPRLELPSIFLSNIRHGAFQVSQRL